MIAMRVLLADDELLARKRLARLLAELPGVTVVAECADAEEVIARVRQGGIELALLDIHMPGLSGLDALGILGDARGGGGPAIVFCTAHADHAVAAFEGGAIDYLLKPIELERLRKAVDRARARAAPRPAPPIERMPFETRQGIVLVDPARITHAVLDGALVTVSTLEGELVTDYTLQDLERRLPEGRFIRVHRRALLALEHVARLEPVATGGYAAHTVRGQVVEVSRQAARALRRRLGLSREDGRGDDDDGDA
jgi:two-component system LytT family response regulator